MTSDPTTTNPALYRTVFENDRVRVLEYRDAPGDRTTPHGHPDSVMVTLASFERRVSAGGRQVDLALPAGEVRWLDAQEHTGENTGSTATHVIFVELKDAVDSKDGVELKDGPATGALGPSARA